MMKSEMFLPQQHPQTPIYPYPERQGDEYRYEYTHEYTHKQACLPPPPPYTEQPYSTPQSSREAPAPDVEEDIRNEENFVESTLQWIPRKRSPTEVRRLPLEVSCSYRKCTTVSESC